MNPTLFSRSLLAALVLSLLSVSVASQSLSMSGSPALGQTVSFTTTGTPNAVYALAMATTPGPTSLPPIGNLAIGFPFVFLIGPVTGSPFLPALGQNGQASAAIHIPINFALYGQSFYLQSAYSDPASPIGLSLTNGLTITIASPAVAPTITNIVPASGGASGGTPVTISGSNFAPGSTTVTLGGATLGNLQVVTTTTITGTTPPGIGSTTVPLVVTTTAGGSATLQAAFTFLPEPPTINSITPDHCQVGGGTLITLTGSGLGQGATVYFGTGVLVPILQTTTQIIAIAPTYSQVGTVDVFAISPLGYHFLPSAFRYTIPIDAGTGLDGPFAPLVSVQIDTNSKPGGFDFTTVNVPAGVTVSVIGLYPLRIRCLGQVTISGTLDLRGQAGTQSDYGIGGPGGFPGSAAGIAGNTAINGPGYLYVGSSGNQNYGHSAAFGTLAFFGQGITCGAFPLGATYGSPTLASLLGGSGGCGSYVSSYPNRVCGGGGGGALSIQASGIVNITGTIDISGGAGASIPGSSYAGGGSGGAIRIHSQSAVQQFGLVRLDGGQGATQYQNANPQCGSGVYPDNQGRGGNGRWVIQNWLGQTADGTTAAVPIGVY